MASRCETVLNAVAIPEDPAPGSGGGPIQIGCVGRIHPGKGQQELLEAFALAADDGAAFDCTLHYFGDVYPGNDHLLEELKTQAVAMGVEERVRFHGFVPDPDDIYPLLDLVVAPSTSPESFSLVCAEAQAYGLPVVGPDRAGPAEIMVDGETCLLVDSRDVGVLAAAIVRLVSDPGERERLGRAGRRRAEEQFTLSRYREQFRRSVAMTISARSEAHTRGRGKRTRISS